MHKWGKIKSKKMFNTLPCNCRNHNMYYRALRSDKISENISF